MRAGNWLAWDLIKRIFDTKVGYSKNFVFYEEKDEIILLTKGYTLDILYIIGKSLEESRRV